MRRPDPERPTTPPDGRPLSDQPRWRKDFPIHLPEDEYVSRRDFTKFMVLTSFAFVAGQFWILLRNAARRVQAKPPIRAIASVDDVAVGGVQTFRYPGPHDNCVLIRQEASNFVAYSQACTHLSCAVVPRPEIGEIHCPCHEGLFDLSTGRPIAGPPQRPLTQILIEIRGGTVYATGVDRRVV